MVLNVFAWCCPGTSNGRACDVYQASGHERGVPRGAGDHEHAAYELSLYVYDCGDCHYDCVNVRAFPHGAGGDVRGLLCL